jgi:hypothetical protein
MNDLPFSLTITDAHGVRTENYATPEAAKRASQVLMEQGAKRVTYSMYGSDIWTKIAKGEG